MKKSFDAIEVYPVFSLCDPGEGYNDHTVEFTDEELADLKRVEEEFTAWQVKIRERFGA